MNKRSFKRSGQVDLESDLSPSASERLHFRPDVFKMSLEITKEARIIVQRHKLYGAFGDSGSTGIGRIIAVSSSGLKVIS
jgi:hypothetical protein